jgi:hypothetical protein
MYSFEMVYDDTEDVLEVTFDSVDENFSRSVALSEEIVLHTDANVASGWGLTIYSYSHLLQVGETDLHDLANVDEPYRSKIVKIINSAPISRFLNITDLEAFRARILAPRISDL